MNQQGFLFINLADQVDGPKPFDGMAAGEFVDMSGRRAIFKREDLPTYVKNTKAVLASTADSSGAVVGLPIDGANHDHREAAGWITDVQLSESGDVIQFTPRWNDWGIGLISGDIMRFFSPTIDLGNKTIMGGSLTNWPATRDEKSGVIMLKPIELSAQLMELSNESLLERANNIARAFRETFRDQFETEYAWPIDVFDGYVICEMDGKLYKVEFDAKDGGYEFAAFEEWVEVVRAYVEAMQSAHEHAMFGEFSKVSDGGNSPADNQPETGVIQMEMTEQQLAELVTKTVAAAMATSPKPASDPKDAANLSALLDLDGLSEAAKEQRKAELSQMIEASRRQAKIEFEAQLASLAHESKMADLAQKLVTGSDKTPRGFSVPVNDLQAHLMKMSPADAAWWGEFLTNTLEQGFVEFGERGHGRPMQGTQVLPDGIAAALQSWLDAGQKIDEFFRVNAVELGNMSDYNLAAFQPKEK